MSERLPRNYIPTHYDLFLHFKDNEETFDAIVTITYQKNKEDSKTYLNIQSNITIKSIIQNNTPLKYSIDNDILTIFCSSLPDQDISSNPITINYSVAPTANGTQGFYSRDDSYFTEFEPNNAQMLLPCFDDPIVKSTFSVKLQIPSKLTGLSNMPVETSKIIDNEKELTFAQTPPMCVYLLAIFVGDFASIEGETKNGLPVKMYGENGRQELLKDFLKGAIFAVNWMEEKIGVKYELPHLQLLSHPGLKIGMENYGLIALEDYTRGSDFLKSLLTVLHEVSHLWFGDLVSVKWWDSVWLNEGFAQYFQYLILRDFSEEYSSKAIERFIENDGVRCLNYFDEEKVVPNEDEIDLNQEVLKTVIYKKGAFILKMFSDIVGEVNFFKVCSNWISAYKNKNGEVKEFIEIVNKTLNSDYSNFFNTWLTKIGYPHLNVTETNTGIKICQESFTGAIYQFNIPIIYENDGEIKKIDVLMNEKEKEIDLKFDWALVNGDMESLCTVNYSKFLLEKLIPVKKAEKVKMINFLLIGKSFIYYSTKVKFDDDVIDILEQIC